MTEMFNGWMWVGGAAAFTLIASCFGYIKSVYLQVISRVVVTMSVSGFQADAVLLYLRHHYKVSRFGPRAYLGWKLFYRPRRRVQLMPMEVAAPSGRIYWRNWWCPVWVGRSKENVRELETGVTAEDYNYLTLVLTFARGTLDPDRFIVAATQFYNDQTKAYDATDGRRHSIRYVHGSAGLSMPELTMLRKREQSCPTSGSDIRGCLVHRPLGFDFAELGLDADQAERSTDRLALNQEGLAVVQEARRWHESEQWHLERQLPWRRGFLLYGPPGTGKTALARAIAEELDLPIYVFDLASLRNDEMQKAWNQMLEEVPCMALMEDIDTVFHGRQNVAVTTGPALTFDCLLNCLDGVQRADGLITVMTTNHLERIDPAIGQVGEIGSRPGRIDRIVHMGCLDEAGRRKIAARILTPYVDAIEEVCCAGSLDTPAQFQERCARLALSLHYGDIEGSPTASRPEQASRSQPEAPWYERVSLPDNAGDPRLAAAG